MPQTHWQTSILQTPLWLDNLQYEETTKFLQTILIPTSLWPSTLTTTAQASDACSKSSTMTQSPNTSDFRPNTSLLLNKSSPSHHLPCLALPLPSSSLPALRLLSTVLQAPPISLPLPLLTVLQVKKWHYPTNK